MHSHTIALALAQARIADRQRAIGRGTATKPPRRHRRARACVRALLAVAATAALSALTPTGALAQPPHDAATATARAPGGSDMSTTQIDAADHAAAIRSINLNQLDRHPAPLRQPATVSTVRVTRVPGGDFDWIDASIGAGLTAALLLGAASVASLRGRPTHPAR